MNSIIDIGMDVHKNSYSLCAVSRLTGEITAEKRVNADLRSVLEFIGEIKRRYGEDVEITAAYEAGCLGYTLYRQLNEKGIRCMILAPATMKKSAKNRIKKNDRMDARNIASNISNADVKTVYVPSEEDEDVKDYIRMIDDFKDELRRVKQEILAFMLRRGEKYPGKSYWTAAHMEWLKNVELSAMRRDILNEYLSEYASLKEKIERYQTRLEEISKEEKYDEKVSQLRCFKGIDTTSAMILQAEICDFVRFPNARAFSAYCGLVPGQDESGDKNSSHMPITKMGNIEVRTTLVECAQALVRGKIGEKSKRVQARQKGQDVRVIDYADKGVLRMQKKFHEMIYRKIPYNKAITAIARELACFVWGMETGEID